MFSVQVDIPTHFNGLELIRVTSVILSVKSSFIKNEKLRCNPVPGVNRVGADDTKNVDANVLDISCSKSNVRCSTFA